MKLSDYILLPRTQRIEHIDLSLPCELNGNGHKKKQILLDFLQIENDVENWTKGRIHRCHLCSHGRGNGWCINPKHFYFGTASENQLDLPKEFRVSRGAASSTKGLPHKCNRDLLIRFCSDIDTDESLLKVGSRKLAKKYDVSHFTIQRWKKFYLSQKEL